MAISYRIMEKKDYNRVKELITQAWFSEYPFKKKIIRLYAKAYLYSYLAEANFQRVACDGDKVCGFIFGRYKKAKRLKALRYNFKLLWILFRMLFSKPGRRGLKIAYKTEKVNAKLMKPFKKQLKNELVLFIVDDAYHGQGIGSSLEKSFIEFLNHRNADNVYLYTDTYSNFHFYEHRGYERFAELEVDFGIKDEDVDGLPVYYLYARKLK